MRRGEEKKEKEKNNLDKTWGGMKRARSKTHEARKEILFPRRSSPSFSHRNLHTTWTTEEARYILNKGSTCWREKKAGCVHSLAREGIRNDEIFKNFFQIRERERREYLQLSRPIEFERTRNWKLFPNGMITWLRQFLPSRCFDGNARVKNAREPDSLRFLGGKAIHAAKSRKHKRAAFFPRCPRNETTYKKKKKGRKNHAESPLEIFPYP